MNEEMVNISRGRVKSTSRGGDISRLGGALWGVERMEQM